MSQFLENFTNALDCCVLFVVWTGVDAAIHKKEMHLTSFTVL